MTNNTLIDRYMPEYTFNEYHEIVINGSIEDVYNAARNFDLSKSRLIKFLFKLRGMPTKRLKFQDFIADIGFSNIEENFPVENLMGFWFKSGIQPVAGFDEFFNNSIGASVKVVWNFYLKKIDSSHILLSTETRVLCVSSVSKVTFRLYWFFIKPFSGIIRRKMLGIVKGDVETPLKGKL